MFKSEGEPGTDSLDSDDDESVKGTPTGRREGYNVNIVQIARLRNQIPKFRAEKQGLPACFAQNLSKKCSKQSQAAKELEYKKLDPGLKI